MDRLQKKCLIASAGTHVLLLLLLVLGSAFFVSPPKPQQLPRINVVPDTLVDDLLAKGGGNPKLAMTDERVKGDTLDKVKPPEPAPEVKPKPAEVKPPTPKPPPVLPKPTKVTPTKVETAKKPGPEPKPVDTKKDVFDMLKATTRTDKDRKKQQEEAEAAAKAEAARAQARAEAAARKTALSALGKASESLKRGFKDGTRLEVGGPGGAAKGNYGAYVRDAFDNEWKISPSLTADEGVTLVEVTIARDGRIIRKRIIEPSNIRMLDQSVQRALDSVISLPAFPPGTTDDTRIYILEFNLKTKRNLG